MGGILSGNVTHTKIKKGKILTFITRYEYFVTCVHTIHNRNDLFLRGDGYLKFYATNSQ